MSEETSEDGDNTVVLNRSEVVIKFLKGQLARAYDIRGCHGKPWGLISPKEGLKLPRVPTFSFEALRGPISMECPLIGF